MSYSIAANLVLILHLAFVLFAVAGGLLILRWHRVVYFHLPTVLWATLIEFQGWLCPLTPLELSLRQAAGEQGYSGGFVEHYIVTLLYPDNLDQDMQILLGSLLIMINIAVYALVLWRRKHHPHE